MKIHSGLLFNVKKPRYPIRGLNEQLLNFKFPHS